MNEVVESSVIGVLYLRDEQHVTWMSRYTH